MVSAAQYSRGMNTAAKQTFPIKMSIRLQETLDPHASLVTSVSLVCLFVPSNEYAALHI